MPLYGESADQVARFTWAACVFVAIHLVAIAHPRTATWKTSGDSSMDGGCIPLSLCMAWIFTDASLAELDCVTLDDSVAYPLAPSSFSRSAAIAVAAL
jgi:hypothetical protein